MYMESSYLSFIVILSWFMQSPPPNVTVPQVPTYITILKSKSPAYFLPVLEQGLKVAMEGFQVG